MCIPHPDSAFDSSHGANAYSRLLPNVAYNRSPSEARPHSLPTSLRLPMESACHQPISSPDCTSQARTVASLAMPYTVVSRDTRFDTIWGALDCSWACGEYSHFSLRLSISTA